MLFIFFTEKVKSSSLILNYNEYLWVNYEIVASIATCLLLLDLVPAAYTIMLS